MANKPIWFIGCAMVALGRHRASNVTTAFCQYDLQAWSSDLSRPSSAFAALRELERLGFISRISKAELGRQSPMPRTLAYVLTLTGSEAAKAAYTEHQRQVRSSHLDRLAQSRLGTGRLAKRLWACFRIRQTLTAEEAAKLLVDAGEPFEQTRSTVQMYLRRWAQHCPDAVKVAVKRVNGSKRYVMVKDMGANPPPVGLKGRTKASEGITA